MKVMKERKTLIRHIIVLISLMLISALLMGGFPMAEMGIVGVVNPLSLSTTMPNPNDGWSLYVDREVGFSFSYPNDALIQWGKGLFHPFNAVTLLFRIPNSYGNLGMVIDVQKNITSLSPEDFARTLWPANSLIPDDFLSKAETVYVGGISALKVDIPPTWLIL